MRNIVIYSLCDNCQYRIVKSVNLTMCQKQSEFKKQIQNQVQGNTDPQKNAKAGSGA
jgi:hypothetical protein